MASERQIAYINSLADKRDLTNVDPEVKDWLNSPEALEQANNKNCDWLITELRAAPMIAYREIYGAPKTELAELEAKVMKGRYFIVDPFDGTEKFVKVDKPEAPSRWAGYTFIHSQASDYFHPVKNPQHRLAILEAIAVDPTNAMNEYGIRLGVCGYCGRTLTAYDSRLRGIGPICADKILGTATDEQLDLLRKLGLKS